MSAQQRGGDPAFLAERAHPMRGVASAWTALKPLIQRLARTPRGVKTLRVLSGTLGRVVLARGIFGISRSPRPAGAAEIVSRWLRFLDATGCPYEITNAGETDVEVEILRCPVGGLPSRAACRAAWEADRHIVRSLGARDLEVLETIGEGRPRCRLRVIL